MFKSNITQTPFTTDAANGYFQNITGSSFGVDCSFLSTLRALLAPRMKDDEKIHLYFDSSNYNVRSVDSLGTERTVRSICCNYNIMYSTDMMLVHNLYSDQEGNHACLNAIESKFTTVYEGYHRLEKVKAFYRKSFNVDCYVNPDLKNVIVFAEKLDTKKIHYLQVSIMAMLPWYFDPKAGISEEEMALVYSLRETKPDKYNQCIAKMAEKYDFRAAKIRKLLDGFETIYERKECEKIKDEIFGIDRRIEDINESIGEYFKRRNDACIRLMGLEKKIADGFESEMMEYFLCNSRLVLDQVDGTNMYFSVKDYLEYFDSEMAERTIGNKQSFVYEYGLSRRGSNGAEKAKKLMTEIFVSENPRLKIRFCASYMFNLNGNVRAMQNSDFGYEFAGYMPNPHIDRFQCMGNYQQVINTLLMKRDYIGAVEQCIASCKSLNWGDHTVMCEFMRNFWSGNARSSRCIELPDGSVVTPVEAIRWLEEQDKPAETEGAESEEKKEETKNEQGD